MAQHDMNIANQGFPATRADLNNALQALASNNSGTSAPSTTFANQWWYDTTNNKLYIRNEANNAWIQVAVLDQTNAEWQIITGVVQAKDGDGLALKTDDGTTRVFLKDDGNVGIGDTSPESNTNFTALTVSSTASTGGGQVYVQSSSVSSVFGADNTSDPKSIVQTVTNHPLILGTNNAERVRVDTSGRVGIGGTPNTNWRNDIANQEVLMLGTEATVFADGGVTTQLVNNAFINNSDTFLNISTRGASQYYQYQGAHKWYTAASASAGSNINTEMTTPKMTLDIDGNLVVGENTAAGVTNGTGAYIAASNGQFYASSSSSHFFNKQADGAVLIFRSAGVSEGNVSISGSTTSYNGGHLSRWSQLADGSEDTSIVKGTVMTNLDQMAVWHHEAVSAQDAVYQDVTIPAVEEVLDDEGNVITEAQPERIEQQLVTEAVEAKDAYTEENEQLNCMAISSVEGDPNVAGVFVNWDPDDDGFNDMNVGMTGDMVIRIAKGVTIARGDLLMSAGDGTAKPQDDDIVRSKTIAKVTSTNVSHTYDDESFCVPCVLMAC